MTKAITPKIIIAVDGYSSSGKSSMAKALARTIGYRYIDSGAMYRAVTLYGMRHGLVADGKVDEKALVAALPEMKIDFKVAYGKQRTLLNGEDVEDEIRSMEVSNNVRCSRRSEKKRALSWTDATSARPFSPMPR